MVGHRQGIALEYVKLLAGSPITVIQVRYLHFLFFLSLSFFFFFFFFFFVFL